VIPAAWVTFEVFAAFLVGWGLGALAFALWVGFMLTRRPFRGAR
jgi:hypothetical protein